MRKSWLVVSLLLSLAPAASRAASWSPPRTPDGVPDLQGVWTNASATKLTRPPSVKTLVVGDAEAERIAKANPQVRYQQMDSGPADPAHPASAAEDVGKGYNGFWLDPGATLGKVKGEWRTSWIVDPADGQLPFSEGGKALLAKAQAYARAADAPADPERLQPWDRCLIGSRGSGGPAMLNNLYNNSYQIVQTKGAVAIVVEMVHDVRIIPLFADRAAAEAGRRPAALQPWLGDSVGWWDKDTLVVETTHVNHEQGRAGPVFLTPEGRVTERFTRTGPKEILYEFQVEDSTYYSRPWRAEMSFTPQKGRLFEYACHEGNYALPDILRGARVADRKAGKAAPSTGDGAE